MYVHTARVQRALCHRHWSRAQCTNLSQRLGYLIGKHSHIMYDGKSRRRNARDPRGRENGVNANSRSVIRGET